MATAIPAGFSSSLSELPDQVLLAHTRSLVLHEQALQLAVLDHLREIHARHLHLRLGFSSLFDYAVRELGYSEGAAWRRTKAMRLCSDTAGTRERLQDGSLSLSAAAQLQNTFDLLQRTATAAADPGAAPTAPELLPGGTGTAPEAGALGTGAAAAARAVPPLDAAQRQELVAQASGKSTREVKQLLAGVAPELARPADRMRALGEGRWELKVVIDSACQCGIEQLRALLSHVHPHLTLGQMVERLVQDGLQRYDPGRPPRGRRGGRREASAGQAPEPQAQEGPAGGAASPAKRGAQEQPGVPPTPEGTIGGGSTPAPAALSAEVPARGIGHAGTSPVATLPAARSERETCRGSTPVNAKPAAAAPGTAASAAKSVADGGSHAPAAAPRADQSLPTARAAANRGRTAPSPAKRAGAQLDSRSRPQAAAAGPSGGSAQPAHRACRSRYIPASVRREVWHRDGGCCSYVDPHSGRRCRSRFCWSLTTSCPSPSAAVRSPGTCAVEPTTASGIGRTGRRQAGPRDRRSLLLPTALSSAAAVARAAPRSAPGRPPPGPPPGCGVGCPRPVRASR